MRGPAKSRLGGGGSEALHEVRGACPPARAPRADRRSECNFSASVGLRSSTWRFSESRVYRVQPPPRWSRPRGPAPRPPLRFAQLASVVGSAGRRWARRRPPHRRLPGLSTRNPRPRKRRRVRILALGAPKARAFIEPLLCAPRGQRLSPGYGRTRGSEVGSDRPDRYWKPGVSGCGSALPSR